MAGSASRPPFPSSRCWRRSCPSLLGSETTVIGCGRTDTGVHASAFYAHFEWEGEFGSRFANWEQACWKLNGMLPPDIGVRRIFEVGEQDHARFSAAERAYTYWVHTGKDPFLEGRSARVYQDLDLKAMNAAAAMLVFQGEFDAFQKTGGGQKTTICDVRHAQWTRTEPTASASTSRPTASCATWSAPSSGR